MFFPFSHSNIDLLTRGLSSSESFSYFPTHSSQLSFFIISESFFYFPAYFALRIPKGTMSCRTWGYFPSISPYVLASIHASILPNVRPSIFPSREARKVSEGLRGPGKAKEILKEALQALLRARRMERADVWKLPSMFYKRSYLLGPLPCIKSPESTSLQWDKGIAFHLPTCFFMALLSHRFGILY